MKPLRLALFLILLIFHAALVFLSLKFSQSLADSIVRNPAAFQFLSILGLVVVLVTFALSWFDRRAARKRIEKLEAEKNAIKAEVFDMRKQQQEREQEIEHEINSFKESLPASTPAKSEPSLSEYPDEPQRTDNPSLAKPPREEQLLTENTESQLSDPDRVEYGPLTPKHPPADENDDTDTPHHPPRS